MAKIIIKNFRAIDYAEIEIKPFTVIIGEQASGKSTISKLVYFFRIIQNEIAESIYDCLIKNLVENKITNINDVNFESIKLKLEKELIRKLEIKFYNFFGSTKKETFNISYLSANYSLSIKPNGKISMEIESFTQDYISGDKLRHYFILFKRVLERIGVEHHKDNLRNFSETIAFPPELIIYVPASRSLITSIVPASQNKFIAEIDNRTEDNQIDYFVKTFLEDIDFYKRNYFFGKSLDEVIDEFELKTGKENPKAKQLRDKIKIILKADYQHGNSGEVLLDKRFLKPISLDKASSGQQEVVWILLTLLSLVLEDNKSFVVIEEPEAHLYPKTQAQVVEYIAQFFNAKEGNEVIITTHSPYILTVLNNLLFAKQISVKTHGVENQTIAENIDPNAWLDIDKFSAYYVGRNDEGQYIKSIINPETGLISVNELDDASDDIMDTFDNLMDIYKGAAV